MKTLNTFPQKQTSTQLLIKQENNEICFFFFLFFKKASLFKKRKKKIYLALELSFMPQNGNVISLPRKSRAFWSRKLRKTFFS